MSLRDEGMKILSLNCLLYQNVSVAILSLIGLHLNPVKSFLIRQLSNQMSYKLYRLREKQWNITELSR